jgi:hypothetical protein
MPTSLAAFSISAGRHALGDHADALVDVGDDAAVGVEEARVVHHDRRLADLAHEVERLGHGAVAGLAPLMISTSIILSTGEKKWMPMNCSGRFDALASSVIGRVEVLVAKMQSSGITASTFASPRP